MNEVRQLVIIRQEREALTIKNISWAFSLRGFVTRGGGAVSGPRQIIGEISEVY